MSRAGTISLRRRRWWVVVPAIAAIAGLSPGCAGERSLDPERLDALVESAIVDGIAVQPTVIDCPPVTGIVDGTTFTCEVTLDGQPLRMEGEVVDASQGTVEVVNLDAVLLVELLEWVIADDVTRQLGEPITVDCGDGEVIVAEVGAELLCAARDTVGNEVPVSVVVDDAEGNVSYELG